MHECLEDQAQLVHGGHVRSLHQSGSGRMMARRSDAKTVEVNASHIACMSQPKEAAKPIEEAATSARTN
jgi:hypothetical protein